MFQDSHGLRFCYPGEVFKEFGKRVPTFQVVEEGLYWNSCSTKNRRSAKNVRIRRDFDTASHHGTRIALHLFEGGEEQLERRRITDRPISGISGEK